MNANSEEGASVAIGVTFNLRTKVETLLWMDEWMIVSFSREAAVGGIYLREK